MSSNNNNNKEDDNSNEICGCACCYQCSGALNEKIEKAFCAVGYIVGQWPYIVLALVLIFLGLCCIGFEFLEFESNIYNLWTPTDSDVFREAEFIDAFWSDKDYGLLVISGVAKEGDYTNVLNEDYLEAWYQIHLDFATRLPQKEYIYTDTDGNSQTITLGYFAGI